MIKTTHKYILSILILFFSAGIYNSIYAQTHVCDSCEIVKNVKGAYFKKLYINYYETYESQIKKADQNRRKIALAFIKYLRGIKKVDIQDYVVDFEKVILKDLNTSESEKTYFKTKIISPFKRLETFIENCEQVEIKYSEDQYNEESINILDNIKKEVKNKFEECKRKEAQIKNKSESKIYTDNDKDSNSSENNSLFSYMNSFIYGVLVGALAMFFFFRKKEKQNTSTTTQNEENTNTADDKAIDNEHTDNNNIENSKEETDIEKDIIKSDDEIGNSEQETDTDTDTEKDKLLKENKDNVQDNLNPSDESKVELTKPKVSFFPDPSNDRLFLMVDGEDKISSFSLYKITNDDEVTTGKIDFLTNINYQIVFDNLERYIYSACDPQNSYIHGKTMNIKQLSEGVVVIRDNKWYVSKKIKIEFY